MSSSSSQKTDLHCTTKINAKKTGSEQDAISTLRDSTRFNSNYWSRFMIHKVLEAYLKTQV